jgi:hypothetical protein
MDRCRKGIIDVHSFLYHVRHWVRHRLLNCHGPLVHHWAVHWVWDFNFNLPLYGVGDGSVHGNGVWSVHGYFNHFLNFIWNRSVNGYIHSPFDWVRDGSVYGDFYYMIDGVRNRSVHMIGNGPVDGNGYPSFDRVWHGSVNWIWARSVHRHWDIYPALYSVRNRAVHRYSDTPLHWIRYRPVDWNSIWSINGYRGLMVDVVRAIDYRFVVDVVMNRDWARNTDGDWHIHAIVTVISKRHFEGRSM